MQNVSISHGTLRPQDLIPAFIDALSSHFPAAYEQIMLAPFPLIPAFVQDEGDSSWWWDSEDAQYLLEDLLDRLNECAPEGFYFGTHPGDGSDFGFWECEQD